MHWEYQQARVHTDLCLDDDFVKLKKISQLSDLAWLRRKTSMLRNKTEKGNIRVSTDEARDQKKRFFDVSCWKIICSEKNPMIEFVLGVGSNKNKTDIANEQSDLFRWENNNLRTQKGIESNTFVELFSVAHWLMHISCFKCSKKIFFTISWKKKKFCQWRTKIEEKKTFQMDAEFC